MKRNLHICFFILAFANNLSAQNPLVKQWDKRFGGNLGDSLSSFEQTFDGGYILGGKSYSDTSGDKSQPSWGLADYWIVKINSIGTKQWDKRFGGANNDVLISLKQTADGGFILGGYSYSGISGDKTQFNWDTTGNTSDFWIVKIDSLGNLQWDKRFGGIYNDYLQSVQQTKDGGFLLGGASYSYISGDKTQTSWGSADYWIVKVDSVGIKQWDKRFGGNTYDYLYTIQPTVDGGYILGGNSTSGISGDKTQPSWGWYDYWLVKVDSIGIKEWDKRFGGTNYDFFSSLQQTTDRGYILGGNSRSDISGDKTQSLWGLNYYDYWIVKIDSLGNKQWDKDFGGTHHEDDFGNISQTIDNGFIFSGTSYSQISGDKTESNLGMEQIWVLKTDSIGAKQWDKTIFTTGHEENGYIIQTKDGCYAIANATPSTIGGYITEPNWDTTSYPFCTEDYWIVKFCEEFIPSVNLSSSDTTFCEKQCINFFDFSTNNPTSWQWFFPGAQPDTSSLQDPTNICYNAYGSFDVTLIACNAAGCDTLVLHNFINEFQNPVDSIWGLNDTLFSLPAYSYQWYSTTGIIAGATNQYFVPTQLGNYFCVVSDSIGCVATSNSIVITAVQSEINNSQFAISPNPFTNLLTITLKNNHPSEITLYDLTSRKLLQQTFTNSTTINTQQLAKGIYFYEVKCMEQVIGKGKVVKE